MNIKEFMQHAKDEFIISATNKRFNPTTDYWTSGICLALTCVVLGTGGNNELYKELTELKREAETLLLKYRPETYNTYWWPNHKKLCSYEDAYNVRLEVFDKIIDSL